MLNGMNGITNLKNVNKTEEKNLDDFFTYKEKDRQIFITVKNEIDLQDFIENIIITSMFGNKEVYEQLNVLERTRIFREILKMNILGFVLSKIKLNPNELYLIKINNFLKSEHFYSLTNVYVENETLKEKLPGGYVIDRITELEYLSKKNLLKSN